MAFRDTSAFLFLRIRREFGIRLLQSAIHLENELRSTISRPGRRDIGGGPGQIRSRLRRRARNRDRGGSPTQRRLRSTVRRGATGTLLGISVRSQPGEPPRRQTGRLWQSITHTSVNMATMSVTVGTNVEHGRHLEFGTRTFTVTATRAKVLMDAESGRVFGKRVKIRIAPRPWLRPTMRREASAIRVILNRPMRLR